jgi:hypothetical protein
LVQTPPEWSTWDHCLRAGSKPALHRPVRRPLHGSILVYVSSFFVSNLKLNFTFVYLLFIFISSASKVGCVNSGSCNSYNKFSLLYDCLQLINLKIFNLLTSNEDSLLYILKVIFSNAPSRIRVLWALYTVREILFENWIFIYNWIISENYV